ncbi:MAG: hypothetical protein AB8G77_22225 [Rhodothermales bacterium]
MHTLIKSPADVDALSNQSITGTGFAFSMISSQSSVFSNKTTMNGSKPPQLPAMNYPILKTDY